MANYNYNYKPKRSCENCEFLIREKSFNGGELFKCAKSKKYLRLGEILDTNCLFGLGYKRKER